MGSNCANDTVSVTKSFTISKPRGDPVEPTKSISTTPINLELKGGDTSTTTKSNSTRSVAQQGLFSVCGSILGNHGEILRDTMPEQFEKALFQKIVIPARLKDEFMRKLRSMNITARALFPGLDGLGRSVTDLIQAMGGSPDQQSTTTSGSTESMAAAPPGHRK